MSWLKKTRERFCNIDLTTEELDDINIDDYQNNVLINRKFVYQHLDQSRRNNNQHNSDDDITFLEDEEMYDDKLGIKGR